VDGVVLGRRDGAEVVGIVALDAFHKRDAKPAGEERILSVSLLATSPPWIAKDIDVGRPDGKSVKSIVIAVQNRVVEFGPGFCRHDSPDLL
jgi:hypothetical protein